MAKIKIRFLRQTPSNTDEGPFKLGQLIEVDNDDPDVRRWLKDKAAEVVPPEATQLPAEPPPDPPPTSEPKE